MIILDSWYIIDIELFIYLFARSNSHTQYVQGISQSFKRERASSPRGNQL